MTDKDREFILQLKPEHVLAITIWGEARGEELLGKIGVAHVVNNRATDNKKRWPRNIIEVCIQPKQFSCWNENDPNFPALMKRVRQGINYDPDRVWRECVWVAGGVVFRYLRDNTDGANHYNTLGVDPAWDDNMEKTVTIGHHEFFKG